MERIVMPASASDGFVSPLLPPVGEGFDSHPPSCAEKICIFGEGGIRTPGTL